MAYFWSSEKVNYETTYIYKSDKRTVVQCFGKFLLGKQIEHIKVHHVQFSKVLLTDTKYKVFMEFINMFSLA